MTRVHRRPLAAVLIAVLLALLAGSTGPAAAAGVDPWHADRVLTVGVPGLVWADLDPERTPELWSLAEDSAIGALSVRAGRSTTCLLDGWATLGAGTLTTFRRVTLPTLWPSILTGTALAFSRALGEFGSVVLVAGNRPLQTKTAPLYIFGEIESGNRHGAMVVSAVLLACSLGVLIGLNLLQRRR